MFVGPGKKRNQEKIFCFTNLPTYVLRNLLHCQRLPAVSHSCRVPEVGRRVVNSKERGARVTTNTPDVQDKEKGPRREPKKAMSSPGALWTSVWKVLQVLDPRASRLLTKGKAGHLSPSRKVRNCGKIRSFRELATGAAGGEVGRHRKHHSHRPS